MDVKTKEIPRLKVIYFLNGMYNTAMDNRTYRLEDKWQKYNDDVARKILKWSKPFTVHMKSQTFDVTKLITILTFHNNFKLAGNSNEVHEGAAMWLSHLFIKILAGAVVNDCTCLKLKRKRLQAKRTIRTYFQVVNYLLFTYVADDVVAETGAEMTTPKQVPNMSRNEYSNP